MTGCRWSILNTSSHDSRVRLHFNAPEAPPPPPTTTTFHRSVAPPSSRFPAPSGLRPSASTDRSARYATCAAHALRYKPRRGLGS